MSVGAVKISQRHAPSGLTADEIAARVEKFEATLFHKHRVVVVRLDKPGSLPRLVTMTLEAVAIARFGKRRAA